MDCVVQTDELLVESADMSKKKSPHKVTKEVLGILISVIGVVLSIIVASATATWAVHVALSDLQQEIAELRRDLSEDISELRADVAALRADVTNLQGDVGEIKTYLYGDGGVKEQLTTINTILNYPVITASSEMVQLTASIEKNETGWVGSSITGESIVGHDADGHSYKVNELVNQTMLLSYQEDGRDAFFLGQYSEDYKWTGHCVTNAYDSEGFVYSVCEYNYDNGKRLDFKSLVYKENGDYWLFSDRKVDYDNGVNIGMNAHYHFDYDKSKGFTKDTVKVSDILYVDSFMQLVNPVLIEYYVGNTSDGYFNDDSGEAYRVTYDNDGYVKTLYIGIFKNGVFNDSTGDAWEIEYSEQDNLYYYMKGVFKNGNYVGETYVPVTIMEVEDIVSSFQFNCDLKWKNE